MSKPLSKEEMRDLLLNKFLTLARYWESVSLAPTSQNKQDQLSHRLHGLVFSILSTLDGSSELPAFTLTPSPHPEDRQFHEEEGNDYWVEIPINDDCHLHEEWSKIS